MALISYIPVQRRLLTLSLTVFILMGRAEGRSAGASDGDEQFTARLTMPNFKSVGENMAEKISDLGASGSSLFGSLGSGGGYSGGGGTGPLGLGGSGSDENGCCGLDFDTFIVGFVLVSATYLLFFLLNATVTSGRRRREIAGPSHDKDDQDDESLKGNTEFGDFMSLFTSVAESVSMQFNVVKLALSGVFIASHH